MIAKFDLHQLQHLIHTVSIIALFAMLWLLSKRVDSIR